MSFLLPCPNCGARDVNEFAYAVEVTTRPRSAPSLRELTSYIYFPRNVAGVQPDGWNPRPGGRERVGPRADRGPPARLRPAPPPRKDGGPFPAGGLLLPDEDQAARGVALLRALPPHRRGARPHRQARPADASFRHGAPP